MPKIKKAPYTRGQGKQHGFVLALALLMMLFVGIVVITSADRTGQETRTAQSNAPTATLQAAAEAGLLTLRRRIDQAGQDDGICSDATEDAEAFCSCIEDEVQSSGLSVLFGDSGYSDSESLFSSRQGLPDTYWWFVLSDEDFQITPSMETDGQEHCRFVARVYAGDPDASPGYFMTGRIDIDTQSNPIDNLFGLGGNKKFTDLTAEDIAKFYEDGYLDSLDNELFSSQQLSPGGTVDPSSLSTDKVNLVILEGSASLELSTDFQDKQLIILSQSNDEINFSVRRGPGGGQGAGAGGIEGWIIAPNANISSPPGTPKISMNVQVSGCNTGNQQSCFHESGGSSFDGEYGSENFNFNGSGGGSSNGSGTGKVEVQRSEQMQMDFDY